MATADEGDVFPPKPRRPSDEDCCGSGCVRCVFDVYEAKVKRWEQQCREIREGTRERADREERDVFLSELRYKPFRLKAAVDHTRDTKVYTFQAVVLETGDSEGSRDVDEELGLKMGQHVVMRGKARDGGNVSRAYTPIADRPGEFDVLVRLYPDGEMSRHFRSLARGDVVHFRGPYGSFAHRRNGHTRVVMLCAGTGIAPMVSVARAVVADDREETFVRLLACVRTCDDILLRDELRALAANWNFTAQIHVSAEADRGAARYGESVVYDRLGRDTLRRELADGAEGTRVLVCGTQGFNDDMREHALALGVQPSNIYVF